MHAKVNVGQPQVAAPKVLLTDTIRSPGSARLAIGLSKAGSEVSALCPTGGHPLRKTHVVQQAFNYSGLHPLESLSAAIEAAEPQIVIPCDDLASRHLRELYERTRRLGTSGTRLMDLIQRSLGSPSSYRIVSARYDILEIAGQEGIRTADTRLIHTVDDLKSWHSAHPPPWLLKADGTWGGRGVRLAQTLRQAEEVFSQLRRPLTAKRTLKRLIVNRDSFLLLDWWNRSKPAVIVQAHIQGRPANCAAVCWEGKVLAGFGVEVVSSTSSTGPATVVRVVDNPEMMLAAERIARRLGLSGFFGLDFMIEDGSNAAYLIEMNPRSTPVCHLQLGQGRDMIEALWAKLSGQPLREKRPVTEKNLIAYFPHGVLSKSEWLASSFLDVPEGEPELVQELLRPWPDRSLLFRAVNSLSATQNDSHAPPEQP